MAYHIHTSDFFRFSFGFCLVFFHTLILNYVLCLQVRKKPETVIGTAFGTAALHLVQS